MSYGLCLMRIRVFLRLFASLLKILAVLLLVPGAVAAIYSETGGVIAFAATSLISLATGIVLGKLSSEEKPGLREAFALVALGWLGAAFLGPFLMPSRMPVDGFSSQCLLLPPLGHQYSRDQCPGYWTVNTTLPTAAGSRYAAATGEADWRHRSFGIRSSPDDTFMGLLSEVLCPVA